MRGLARRVDAEADSFTSFFERPIRPFPESYDRRSARVRVSLLVQINSGQPRNPHDGEIFDGSAVFSDLVARDIPYFFPYKRRPAVSNPANRVILPEGFPRNARQSFVVLPPGEMTERVLASHFISAEAMEALRDSDFDLFVKLREHSILDAEQEFLSSFGLTIDRLGQRNEEEIDAEK